MPPIRKTKRRLGPATGDEPIVGTVKVTRIEGEVMAAVNVRLPRPMFDWLNDQAAEDGIRVSDVVRNAIAAAIVRRGDYERYGIQVVDEDAL